MKSLISFICCLLLITTSPTFAARILSYPVGQSPECNQSFEGAASPKTLQNVMSSIKQMCMSKQGVRITHKELNTGNSIEPTNELLSCIGTNPVDYTIFDCTYSSRDQ